MFSFSSNRTRSSLQDTAEGALDQLLGLARWIGREGAEVQTQLASAPDHLRAAGRHLDRLGFGPAAIVGTGRLAARQVGRNPSLLAPLLVVGAAVAVGYWLAKPANQPVAAPYVKRET